MKQPDMEESLLRRSRDLAECTGHFLETIEALRSRGQKDVETIWNAACHVNIVDHDISVFLYFNTTTEDVWARRSVARALATLLYEAIEDLPALFGGPFVDACVVAGVYQEFEGDFKATKKKLSEFSKQHHSFLRGIRVNAGAHKEHDALKFITAVVQADDCKMVDLARQFSTILIELGRFSSAVIEKVNAEYRKKGLIP
jgi:hypothetical protein